MRGIVGVIVALVAGLTLAAAAGADPGASRSGTALTTSAAVPPLPVPLGAPVAAPAEAGATFDDPGRDTASEATPDVTSVHVWSDAAGVVTFRIEIGNVPDIRGGDVVAIFLDTDRNEETGSAAADGADYAILLDGKTRALGLGQWRIGTWVFTGPQGSLAASWSGGPTIRLKRSALGGAAGFRFWIAATFTDADGTISTDAAPSRGVWDFAPVVAEDQAAPAVKAVASAGRAGHVLPLRYRLRDDSGATRERVRVFRNGRLLWTYFTELAPSRAGVVYWVPWEAAYGLGRRLRFCVKAWDGAGNASAPSCAPLRVRR
jgi:hypothetical protein